MKYFAYIRVSTIDQAGNGVSLDAQRAAIDKWAEYKGVEIEKTFEDAGISGSKTNRPGFQAAISETLKSKGTLVVFSLSRLARRLRDLIDVSERFKARGCHLVTISENIDTSTYIGEFFYNVFGSIAQLEIGQVSARTKAALEYKRQNGERLGGWCVPYGYDCPDGKKLVKNTKEQLAIVQMARMRKKGHTLQAICDELTKSGVATRKKGGNWKPCTVSKILRRERA